MKKLLSIFFSFLLILLMALPSVQGGHRVEAAKDISNLVTLSKANSYDAYLSTQDINKRPATEFALPLTEFSAEGMEVEILKDFEGFQGQAIKTEEEGSVEWTFNIQSEGFYSIYMDYFPVEGKSSAIERSLTINGEIPFEGASHLIFNRVWTNASEEILQDARGNDIRPTQKESPIWQSVYYSDDLGYYTEPYLFYFKAGENTLALESVREPLVIGSLILKQYPKLKSYEELRADYDAKGYKFVENALIKRQGEKADYKSDPTLYPLFDRSTPSTEPYNKSKISLNIIGGERWSIPGQTITWIVDVDKAGLYKLDIKFRQNYVRGAFVSRRLLIDGQVPFEEADRLDFQYNSRWQVKTLGDEKDPYLIYLDEGQHTLTLEVTLGELSNLLRKAEDSLYELNKVYRKFLMITGSSPDIYRDYSLDKKLPDAMKELERQSVLLAEVSQEFYEITGQKGSSTAILDKLSYELNDFYRKPDSIPERFTTFKDNIGALGTWILETRDQPLEIDYITLASHDYEVNPPNSGFLKQLGFQFMSFFYSFFEDYNSIGVMDVSKEAVTVWISSGRDQAQVLKTMIDDDFTPFSDIPVNIRLVQGGVLLPATVAGIGPDVALQVGAGEPVNYAVRNAVQDLSAYPGFSVVMDDFMESAVTPYRLNDGVYALPETQSFPMLFYRKDILEELNLQVPETWEDVFEILPEIQKNNMEFAVPASGAAVGGAGISTFYMLLFQNGGDIYKGGGIASDLDTEIAIRSFKDWTELFTNYKLPLFYDFANRFRIGEIPIGIADYSLYNTLSVFAPEIRGLWEFAPVPGTLREDGTIDRSAPASGTACMLMNNAADKGNSWEFLAWWVGAQSQIRYAREMESIMGPAARYQTANVNALKQLPWPIRDYTNLSEQMSWVKGIPEVPGGYFTPRHLDNAFRKVVISGEDVRETILDYVLVINEEITAKRNEFGMPVLELD